MNADIRTLQARANAHASWAKTVDPTARTEPARLAFLDRFERQVDPEGTLPVADRARMAAQARRSYFLGLAAKSAAARRKRAKQKAATALPETGPRHIA